MYFGAVMWLIALLICSCFVVTGLLVRREIKKVQNRVTDYYNWFITAPNKETPSPFQATVTEVAKMASPVFTMQLKTSLMGKASAVSKAIDAIEGDIEDDGLAKANPMMAALMEFSPSLKKRVKKSPLAKQLLSGIDLSSFINPGSAPAVKSNNGSGSFHFGG